MQPPFHGLTEFVSLSAQDIEIVRGWLVTRRTLPRARMLRREGDPITGVFFLLEGWVCASLMLRNGRRQIVKVYLPGDMLGFPSLALPAAGETLEAITNISVCTISAQAIGKLLQHQPRLAAGLFLSTQKERVALMQKLSWVGAATAMERLSAFLLDLLGRLDLAGLVQGGRFDFPLTQTQLGELLGLTAVHVNRTLKRLDQMGYVVRGKGWIRIVDLPGLQSLAPNLPPQFAGTAAWTRLGGDLASRAHETDG